MCLGLVCGLLLLSLSCYMKPSDFLPMFLKSVDFDLVWGAYPDL